MKISTSMKAVAIAGLAALALTSCAANEAAPETTTDEGNASAFSGTLVGVGASSMGAAQEAWAAGFQTANPDVTVNYDPQGSGAGRETLQAGGSDFAGSDRAFKVEEIAEGPFELCAPDSGILQLPLYVSPIAIIFNLDGIEHVNMDADTIAKVFRGDITKWNDPVITAQNEGVELPDLDITPVHRSDESGTTENFVEYLSAAAGSVWTDEVSGDWPTGLPVAGEAAQGTSGVVEAVTGGNGTIGYADASRAGDLGTIAVKVGSDYVAYSPEAAAAVVDASPLASESEARTAGDLAIVLDRSTDASGVYPIVLVAYSITCETFNDAAVGELVKGYLTYVASEEGQKTAQAAAGNAPISSELRSKVTAALDLIS
ncbi:MAG: phosphate ABC transporter substrate-binding protein PstS [Microbacteriaceae bacterium]|nr:phosphate ABC transporter substrate-binding protein PstS [Microbacteriaceae bacterium]